MQIPCVGMQVQYPYGANANDCTIHFAYLSQIVESPRWLAHAIAVITVFTAFQEHTFLGGICARIVWQFFTSLFEP